MGNDDFEEELLWRCLDSEDPATALATACAAHPELAASLRRRHACLMDFGLLAAAQMPDTPQELGGCRLTRLLGHGGMGLVYAAVESATGDEIAIKLIQPDQAWLPLRRERFRREAAVLARLCHPGIVRIRTFGEHGHTPYLAMEMVPGRTLAGVIAAAQGRQPHQLEGRDLQVLLGAEGGPAAPMFAGSWCSAVAHVAHDLALALSHAHAHGIVHRDVKPSNVLVTGAGRVVVIDFGLARDVDVTAITTTGANPGSLPYMAPEVLLGNEAGADPRVDVYGVGAVLYELLTLRPAFAMTTAEALRASIIAGEAAAPRRLNPAIPRDLETVCLRAMATEPQHRYADMAALVQDLGNVLAMRPIAMRPLSRWRRVWRRARRRPLLTATVIGALLALPVAGVALGHSLAHAAELRAGAAVLRQQQYEELLAEGFLHLEQGNRSLALATFTKAEAASAGDLFATAGRMLAHLDHGEPEQALAVAASTSGAARRTLMPLEIQTLKRLGRTAEADQLALAAPGAATPADLFLQGRTMLQGNESIGDLEVFRQAEDLISRAIALAPHARLLFWCDRVHAAGHARNVRALREGSEVLERLWPQSSLAWFWIGYAREYYDAPGAIAAFRRALAIAPAFLQARHNLAQQLVRVGETGAARAAAEQMLVLAPADTRSWLVVGYTSERAGDDARAHEAYAKALQLEPDHHDALLNLGVLERRLGHLEEAERLFIRALEVMPACAPAHACRASMFSERGELDEAIASARRAVTLDPGLPYAQRVLALALARRGDGDAARTALREAVQLEPGTEATHDLAREIMLKLGDEAGLAAEEQRWQGLRPSGAGR